jgi:hypothetical protein
MSLVGEVFAKEFAREKKIDWRRVMQLLASYNWDTEIFDVRLKLSGLENLKEEILKAFIKFLMNLKESYLFVNKSILFSFLGDKSEIEKRIKSEIEKKVKIQNILIENSKKFTSELVRKIYVLEPMVFLRGSASPKSSKIFWYYEDEKEKIFISDIDLEIVLPDFDKKLLNYFNSEAYKFSLKEKVPINVYLTRVSELGNDVFSYGYPVFIPYNFYQRSVR